YPFRAPSCADEKNLLEPGDTVIVLNIGSSRLGQLKNCSGTPDNPIIYKGPGSIINLSAENVSNIEFDGISFIGLSAFGPALKINGDNIVVKNSEITGSDWGIDVGSGTGLVIENCKFMNSTKGGIRKDTDSSAILTKNIFYNVGEHAMLLKGTNTIRNCTIRNTGIGIEVLSGNTEAVNTVVSDCEKGFVCGDGAVLTNSYTMFYNCDTPATGCALGENTLYDNPKLVDFVPAPDSPAVDAGKDVGLPYNGIAIDLGAIESEQNEYVRVTDDISDIEEGTFVTLGEGHAVTSTEPIVLTREDRLGGIECSQHPDSYNFGEIALGDRVVFKGVVSNGRIGVFEVISKQPGEELKPFAAYNLLNEYMPQSVVGKLKRLGNGKQAVIDTGKELVTAMLPEDFSGNVYIDDIVSATGVVRRDCIYAQRMDDFAIIRTDVPRIDAKYDPRLPIRSAEYTLTGFVPVNDPNSIWGRVWKVNSVSGNPASIKIDCKGLTISEIMIRMKFDRIPNGHWSLISTNSASDQSPYSVGYENGETTYKWTFANVSDTTIILTPVEQEPTGTAYSATVSALYIK
ncbi:MAG: right-handed parallel beta-helix repeat-containing protein, partial [Abditibacteriota bacterium]|nr:right-handed parallel beta-helix repeat-containing protein [Abditibacteriota bacterium]